MHLVRTTRLTLLRLFSSVIDRAPVAAGAFFLLMLWRSLRHGWVRPGVHDKPPTSAGTSPGAWRRSGLYRVTALTRRRGASLLFGGGERFVNESVDRVLKDRARRILPLKTGSVRNDSLCVP
jgi:hypothetical protein